MNDISIVFDVSVLGLVAFTVWVVSIAVAAHFYLKAMRMVAEIHARLVAPVTTIHPAFQAKLMADMAVLHPHSPRRVAITRRLRAAGVKI